MKRDDDFFVIWRDADGGANKGFLRGVSIGLLVLALGFGSGFVALQRTVAENATFEFGTTHDYEGVLVGEPVPLLVTESRVYFLVDPFKYAFDPQAREQLTGRRVALEATLIERGSQAMLEVVSGTVRDLGEGNAALASSASEVVTMRGEIVDSKCYLGVMNPGHLKPHRACAVNCLRGGIPPVLLTRHTDGARQTVLVSADGFPLKDWILDYVAEPVEVTGVSWRLGPIDLLAVYEQDVVRLD